MQRSLWAMLGFGWRAPRRLADDLMTHHTAIILSYAVPNISNPNAHTYTPFFPFSHACPPLLVGEV